MRKIILAALVVAAMATGALAELKVTGTGAKIQVDTAAFPPDMKTAYDLFKAKCVKCHGLDRSILTIQQGVTPSGVPFDHNSVKDYGAKMLRKSDSDMTLKEVKVILTVLDYMIDEAAK